MHEFWKLLNDFSATSVLIRMLLATLLGGMIGLERTKHGRSAGMRTHILVCLGSSLATLIGLFGLEIGYATDPLRVGAQVVSGIGFLGTGLILVQNRSRIVGLTTAAGLWNTAVIGLSCGLGFYEGALICFAGAMATSLVFPRLEAWFNKNDKHTMLYIELADTARVNHFYDTVRAAQFGELHKLDVVSPRSGHSGRVGIHMTITLPHKSDILLLERALCEIEGVAFAVEL